MKTKYWPDHPGVWLVIILLLALLMFPWSIQAQTDEGQTYNIQHDDSLWKLAEKYLGDGKHYPLIIQASANKAAIDASFTPISNPNLLYPGQKIWIPATSSDLTTPIENLKTTSVATPVTSISTSASTSAAPATPPTGHIAFSFWNNAPNRCTYEINIINVSHCLRGSESCQATRRIFSLNNVSEPALSPDGQSLAFRGWGAIADEIEGNPHPYKGCAQPQAERWLQTSPLDATAGHNATKFFEDSHPDWSPDGTRFLFDSGRNGDGITRILLVYADGSGEEELHIAGQQPSWAPDNKRFVYRGCDQTGNRCGLWLAKVIPIQPWEAGLNVIGPLLDKPEAAHPDWSPVAGEIVYQDTANGSWDIYLINADGAGQRRLTTNPGLEGLPAWSPDGQWIAYVSYDGLNWSLRLISRDGVDDRHLFTYDGGLYALPRAVEPYGWRDWGDEQISWSQ